MGCGGEFKATVQPCCDFQEIRFVLWSHNTMPNEEINQDQRAIGLEFPIRQSLLGFLDSEQVELLDFRIAWLRDDTVVQLDVINIFHLWLEQTRFTSSSLVSGIEVGNAASCSRISPNVVLREGSLLHRLTDNALRRLLPSTHTPSHGVIQHARERRLRLRPSGHPNPHSLVILHVASDMHTVRNNTKERARAPLQLEQEFPVGPVDGIQLITPSLQDREGLALHCLANRLAHQLAAQVGGCVRGSDQGDGSVCRVDGPAVGPVECSHHGVQDIAQDGITAADLEEVVVLQLSFVECGVVGVVGESIMKVG